ncbi:MAC/Perforin domain-containing protein [Dysgonomonas alginatilytica]|uniref:MAC/Perforin domain-containing protein n=1 Tax=Dysgonomonas alginatilytica TaxID=1605892 RepID=A0A2V3PME8_9BACT|nr:hypothetical protein [Dysgonomonas alginatilytica]PXV63050.1 MAC/Perforin domain-containing protein [Dysgonomonas alginatilytica]
MKKLLSVLFVLVLACVSCSDGDDLTGDPDPNRNSNGEDKKNPYKTGKDLSSSTFAAWDNKGMKDTYFMLGYGYDVTGKYAHPSAVRNKVIDLEAYDKDEDAVTFFKSTSSGPEWSIGRTRQECLEVLGENAGFSSAEISKYKNLFKEKFDSPFKNDSSFPNLSYYYMGTSQVNVVYHLYFFFSSYRKERFQTKYLTDGFKADLETKSAEEIIKIYGTHILSSIKVGERMDYLYRYAPDENSNSYSWFLYNTHKYFSQGPSAWGSAPENDPPLKENLYIEVVDGTRPNPNTWMVDITNYQGERIIFNGWNTITDDNLTLVAFRNRDCLIPIYELVKDTVKKEALIKAYEKYLSE